MTFPVREESIHPVASYPAPLREFASDSSLTAFDSVLPMSDSDLCGREAGDSPVESFSDNANQVNRQSIQSFIWLR